MLAYSQNKINILYFFPISNYKRTFLDAQYEKWKVKYIFYDSSIISYKFSNFSK